jgi:hypothetical protein
MSKEYEVVTRNVQEIVKAAMDEDNEITEDAADKACAELAKLGIGVFGQRGQSAYAQPVAYKHGRTFFEVMIYPFAAQIADEDGDPIDEDDQLPFNASGSEWSNEYGNLPEDYPADMFRTGWSVSSWVGKGDNDPCMHEVEDEEFSDFETANAFAELLAEMYHVPIDHRY